MHIIHSQCILPSMSQDAVSEFGKFGASKVCLIPQNRHFWPEKIASFTEDNRASVAIFILHTLGLKIL